MSGNCYQIAWETIAFDRPVELSNPLRELFERLHGELPAPGRLPEFKLPEGAELVHGYPRLQRESEGHPAGTKYGHAWVEFRNADGSRGTTMVWDPLTLNVLPSAIYYKIGRIDSSECQRYDRQEARAMAARHETYGPWEDVPDGAAFGDD